MKAVITLISSIVLFSCTKDWECCVETTTSGHQGSLSQFNGTSESCIDWRGTNEEKNEFEESGTRILNQTQYISWDSTYQYTLEQKTTCKVD